MYSYPRLQNKVVPKPCQQHRTGKVRRRLHYTNLICISRDHDAALIVRQDDISQSSDDMARLTDTDISCQGSALLAIPGANSSTLHQTENSDEASTEFLSQRLTPESSSDPDLICSGTKDMRAKCDIASSHVEKALLLKESRNLAFCASSRSEHLGQFYANQVNDSIEHSTKTYTDDKDEDQEQRRGSRNRKPKVLFELNFASQEDERTSQKPQKKLRQIKIMRQLGLAAPYGSPYITNYVLRTAG